MATAIFPAHHGQTQREAVREHITLLRNRLRPLGVPVTFDIFGLTASATTGDLASGRCGRISSTWRTGWCPWANPAHTTPGPSAPPCPTGDPNPLVGKALTTALQPSRPHPAAA